MASATVYPAFSRVKRSTRRRLSLSSTSRISATECMIDFSVGTCQGDLQRKEVVSFSPGFSPVWPQGNRLNGFPPYARPTTGLKSGVNEMLLRSVSYDQETRFLILSLKVTAHAALSIKTHQFPHDPSRNSYCPRSFGGTRHEWQQQNRTRIHDLADGRYGDDHNDCLDRRRARRQIIARAFQTAKLRPPLCHLHRKSPRRLSPTARRLRSGSIGRDVWRRNQHLQRHHGFRFRHTRDAYLSARSGNHFQYGCR